MNAIRCAVATVLFWTILLFGDPLTAYGQVLPHEWAALFGSMIAGVCMGDTIFLMTIKEIGASHAMAVGSLQPLTTLFFEFLLFRSPVSWTFFVGSCFVVIGVIWLSRASRQTPQPSDRPQARRLGIGMLLGLSAAVLWGLSTVLLKVGLVHLTPVQANSARLPFVTIILYTTWGFTGQKMERINLSSLLWIASTGVLSMGLGSLLYLIALGRIGPSKTATLIATSPVFSLVMASVFLKENITLRLALGVGLCVIGVWWVSI